jgi:hypothetical protein
VDATITLAHSSKEHGEGTFKKTFGFHSLGVWIDNTRELAALMPRPGGAGSNSSGEVRRPGMHRDHRPAARPAA